MPHFAKIVLGFFKTVDIWFDMYWLLQRSLNSFKKPNGLRELCLEQAESQFVISTACSGQIYTDVRMGWAALG